MRICNRTLPPGLDRPDAFYSLEYLMRVRQAIGSELTEQEPSQV